MVSLQIHTHNIYILCTAPADIYSMCTHKRKMCFTIHFERHQHNKCRLCALWLSKSSAVSYHILPPFSHSLSPREGKRQQQKHLNDLPSSAYSTTMVCHTQHIPGEQKLTCIFVGINLLRVKRLLVQNLLLFYDTVYSIDHDFRLCR